MSRVNSYLTNVLMLGLAIAFLVHFSLIVKYKQVLIQEPDMTWLVLEITLFTSIIGYGAFNIIKLLRR